GSESEYPLVAQEVFSSIAMLPTSLAEYLPGCLRLAVSHFQPKLPSLGKITSCLAGKVSDECKSVLVREQRLLGLPISHLGRDLLTSANVGRITHDHIEPGAG